MQPLRISHADFQRISSHSGLRAASGLRVDPAFMLILYCVARIPYKHRHGRQFLISLPVKITLKTFLNKRNP